MGQEATQPVVETDNKPQQQPRYNVVLWNDEDHTYEYVIHMLKELFGFNLEQGFKLATKVDNNVRHHLSNVRMFADKFVACLRTFFGMII